MKLFLTSQIRALDRLTIENEPITSVNLMERAAIGLYSELVSRYETSSFYILAGFGNNGGDGLALARLLVESGRTAKVLLFDNRKLSADCAINKRRFQQSFSYLLSVCTTHFTPPQITSETIIVDALFGSGISRPIVGVIKKAVDWINSLSNDVISIDTPSGLPGEKIATNADTVVCAKTTLTLQFPKIALLFAENEPFVGEWSVVDIGLDREAIAQMHTPYFLLDHSVAHRLHRNKLRFSHKGNNGTVFLYAGSYGMAGAAILSARAALRSGAGLVRINSVAENRTILQTAVPEATWCHMASLPTNNEVLALGSGIGVSEGTQRRLKQLLEACKTPCVLDADALNVISQSPKLFELIPKNSILTPHPKEFERLFGKSANSATMLKVLREKAQQYGLFIVLKGANSRIATPNGEIYFNTTGNPGMASGGMGDVLTGIVVALLAQGYPPLSATLLSVYLHGLSADISLKKQSYESLLASDVVESLGSAFIRVC